MAKQNNLLVGLCMFLNEEQYSEESIIAPLLIREELSVTTQHGFGQSGPAQASNGWHMTFSFSHCTFSKNSMLLGLASF